MDELSAYCAHCIVLLPRPATWKWHHPDNPGTQEVGDWGQAVQAHAEGYRYSDSAAVRYGIYAVTWVAGTALCYSHAYFAAKKELEKK